MTTAGETSEASVAGPLAAALSGYRPRDPVEAGDLARVRALLASGADPWPRSSPLHITGSAFIVHRPTRRVLLRWHVRLKAWLQVGGHGDPGETDPLAVALREAQEETGIDDLHPLAGGSLLHVAVVSVPATADEPAHEHADLRYVLSTGRPDMARPEHPDAELRWLTFAAARRAATEPNTRETLTRAERLLADGDRRRPET
jgi:8-oxo-dGTP pyrophosphatase MutT (NUDIX family)